MNKKAYYEEINNFSFDYSFIKDKSIVLSGSTGLIGSYLIDIIMAANKKEDLNCNIYAIGRNKEKLQKRFFDYLNNSCFNIIEHDVNNRIDLPINTIDYFVHLASNTNPYLYSTKPIETIKTNILGSINLMDYAVKCHCKKFLYASSVEVYGENKDRINKFKEDSCGYINQNTLRAGYPESKRCGEALCQAYIKEKELDIVIARFSRVYGPSLQMEDTKSTSQFIKSALEKKDIVLKSKGEHLFSYCYVSDAVSGILYLLKNGKCGEAYNIGDEESEITIKDIAELIAGQSHVNVKFDLPNDVESAGFSKADYALVSCKKMNQLGWKALVHIEEGIKKTITILSD